MIPLWNATCLRVGDALLGWLLAFPRDVGLVVLAVGATGLLLASRRFMTDQPWLRLAHADRQQLRRRIRGARMSGDREALRRFRQTRASIAWRRLKREVPAMLVSTFPLAVLLTWGAERLDYLPPQAGETLQLTAFVPADRTGQVAHLVPLERLHAPRGYVRRVEPDDRAAGDRAGRLGGAVAWTIQWHGPPGRVPLTLRLDTQSLDHPVAIGFTTYDPPRLRHVDGIETFLRLRPYQPFGLPLALDNFGHAAWQPVFLLLVLILFYCGKRLFRLA